MQLMYPRKSLVRQSLPIQSSSPNRSIETAEVVYHAAAILSCRENTDANTWKSSKNHARQSLSASRITSIIRGAGQEGLVSLPFVPYAVSLSLSVSYQQMRYAKVPMYRLRARHDLGSTCDLLDELGEHFYAASIMAKLGRATVTEMNRISGAVTESKQPEKRKGADSAQLEDASEGGVEFMPPETTRGQFCSQSLAVDKNPQCHMTLCYIKYWVIAIHF